MFSQYKILDLMNIRAGLDEYILQTHSTNFFEDSMGGDLNPLTSPLGTPVRRTFKFTEQILLYRRQQHLHFHKVGTLSDNG